MRDLIAKLESLFCDQYTVSLKNEEITIWKILGEATRGFHVVGEFDPLGSGEGRGSRRRTSPDDYLLRDKLPLCRMPVTSDTRAGFCGIYAALEGYFRHTDKEPLIFLHVSTNGLHYGTVGEKYGSQVQDLKGPCFVLCFLDKQCQVHSSENKRQ